MGLLLLLTFLVGISSARSILLSTQDCGNEIVLQCASNGLTYVNECVFQVARSDNATLSIVSTGLCPIPSAIDPKNCEKGCTREYIPLCGSDSVTYPNECTFRNAMRCKYKGQLWISKVDAC